MFPTSEEYAVESGVDPIFNSHYAWVPFGKWTLPNIPKGDIEINSTEGKYLYNIINEQILIYENTILPTRIEILEDEEDDFVDEPGVNEDLDDVNFLDDNDDDNLRDFTVEDIRRTIEENETPQYGINESIKKFDEEVENIVSNEANIKLQEEYAQKIVDKIEDYLDINDIRPIYIPPVDEIISDSGNFANIYYSILDYLGKMANLLEKIYGRLVNTTYKNDIYFENLGIYNYLISEIAKTYDVVDYINKKVVEKYGNDIGVNDITLVNYTFLKDIGNIFQKIEPYIKYEDK